MKIHDLFNDENVGELPLTFRMVHQLDLKDSPVAVTIVSPFHQSKMIVSEHFYKPVSLLLKENEE